ncbi:MAG TPA: TlpA disulfide reductase family protein [Burkholderiales bacterium]|nr:TlpA disulfide reductase family protein [Burkholderiales bacterium]
MSTRWPFFATMAVAIMAIAAGFYAGLSRISPPTPASQSALDGAVFKDLQGKDRRVADWPQKLRILNFWATWCAPCVAEMPLLDEFGRENAPIGVQVLGIGIDNRQNILKFREKLNIQFPLLVADPSTLDLLRALGNTAGALPFSVYVDQNGAIVGQHLGPLDREKLRLALIKMQKGSSE